MNNRVSSQNNMTEEINTIITEFHSDIFSVLKICKKIDPHNADLDWLCRTLSLARDMDPLLIINRSKDKIWTYRDQIINKNEDFFTQNKFSQFIKNDNNRNFMFSFIGLIQKRIKELSPAERELLWKLISKLLVSVTKYKKVTNDFSE